MSRLPYQEDAAEQGSETNNAKIKGIQGQGKRTESREQNLMAELITLILGEERKGYFKGTMVVEKRKEEYQLQSLKSSSVCHL